MPTHPVKLIALLALPLALSGCAASSPPAVAPSAVMVMYIDHEPPQAPAETIPARPNADAVWIGGHWSVSKNDYVWTKGRWALPEPGKKEWQDGKWEHAEHGWHYTEGSWR